MTRRGTLAYYLAAWVCGCFFISLSVWSHATANGTTPFASPPGMAGLLVFYFYSLVFGFSGALLSAFLLRRIAIAAGWKKLWQWCLAGAVIAPAVVFAMGRVGAAALASQLPLEKLLAFVLAGPAVVLQEGVWLAAPAGAVTAFVLCQIHTAFAEDAATPGATPAQNAPTSPA